VIVTKTSNGGLAIAAWNLVDPGEKSASKSMKLVFSHLTADADDSIQRLDEDHGNALQKYAAMGAPLDPTLGQVEQLNRARALAPPGKNAAEVRWPGVESHSQHAGTNQGST
jgi:xylan 1,4-beta-xylosidase